MSKELSLLHILTKKQQALYHEHAKKAGLTDAKFWLFYALVEAGGEISQKSICDNWCYSKQTVNTAATALEKEGYLVLRFAKGSKKQKSLHLTPKGEAFTKAMIEPVIQAEERCLKKLTDRKDFLEELESLVGNLKKELFEA